MRLHLAVAVRGDTGDEPTETCRLNLSNPSAGAAIADGSGTGTIGGGCTTRRGSGNDMVRGTPGRDIISAGR